MCVAGNTWHVHLKLSVYVLLGQIRTTADSRLQTVPYHTSDRNWGHKFELIEPSSRMSLPLSIFQMKLFVLGQQVRKLVKYTIYVGGHK